MELICKNITKSFSEKIVLNNFSYQFDEGGIYLLTGPSGIGKTTLFNLLLGLEKPENGSLQSDGNFSIAFQQPRLFEYYDTYKNIELFAENKDSDFISSYIEELLPKEVIHQPVYTLSTGQKQRVEILRAMVVKSSYVLLDEPFAALDLETAGKTLEFILKHLDKRTLIIASHQIDILKKYNFKQIELA